MATSETARLIAELLLVDKFTPGANKVLKSLNGIDAGLKKTDSRATRAGKQIGTGIKAGAAIAASAVGFLAANVALGVSSLEKLEKAQAQTNAVIKSTKGIAGVTAQAVTDLSEKYESLNATIGDEVVRSTENLLLTFTAIRKDAFEPTLKAILDMNAAMGGDENSLKSVTLQVGKALQDPIKGITALRRVGVNFSADQLKVIKRLVETGHTLDAQKLILAELNKEFGGSFLAQGNTTAGKVAKFKDAIEDLQRTLATALLPVIGKVADGLSKFLADPAVVRGAKDIGNAIAGLFSDKNLAAGADFLKGAFETAKSAAPVVATAAKTTFGFVQAAVSLFKSLPKELQALAIGGFAVNKLTGGLVTNIAGGIIETVGKQFLQRGGTPANPLFVADVTKGLGGLGSAAAGAGGLGLATGAATLAAGVAVSALGIMGLGWLINATSSEAQIAQTTQNVVDENLRKRRPASLDPIHNTVTAGGFDSRQVLSAITAGGFDSRVGTSIADKLGVLMKGAIAAVKAVDTSQFKQMIAALKDSKGTKAVSKAVADAVALVIGKGRGNVENTKDVLATLRRQLSNTHDPKLQAALRSAIAKVEHKVTGRAEVQKQLAKADQIIRSNRTTAEKIRELKAVQQALGTRSVNATRLVQQKIDQARRAEVEATRGVSRTVNAKRWRITNNISVTSRVSVNPLESSKVQTTAKRAYSTLL